MTVATHNLEPVSGLLGRLIAAGIAIWDLQPSGISFVQPFDLHIRAILAFFRVFLLGSFEQCLNRCAFR